MTANSNEDIDKIKSHKKILNLNEFDESVNNKTRAAAAHKKSQKDVE